MGIKDFYEAVNDIAPNACHIVGFSILSGMRIAVDVSIFLYKYLKSAGDDRWIDTFISLQCVLKKNGIKAIYVFDGPNFPIEKKNEQERRRGEWEKVKNKLAVAKEITELIYNTYVGTMSPIDDEKLISDVKAILGEKNIVNFENPLEVCDILKKTIKKYEVQTSPITKEHTQLAKDCISMLGGIQLQADGEAEKLCAELCVAGVVDAVLSEDTDVVVYGTPILLSRIDMKKESVNFLAINDILAESNWTYDQFRDLCILLSCDYNDRVVGLPPPNNSETDEYGYGKCTKHATHVNKKKSCPIGVKSAVCMIDAYKCLEKVEERLEDPEPLNYRRCRELFTPSSSVPKIIKNTESSLDEEKVKEFLKNYKCNISYAFISRAFESPKISYIV